MNTYRVSLLLDREYEIEADSEEEALVDAVNHIIKNAEDWEFNVELIREED